MQISNTANNWDQTCFFFIISFPILLIITALYIVFACYPHAVINTEKSKTHHVHGIDPYIQHHRKKSVPQPERRFPSWNDRECVRVSAHSHVPATARIQSVWLISSRCVASQIRKWWFSESVPALCCIPQIH